MRTLFALLALVGLLLSAVAATAAAPACLHHHDAADMAAMMDVAAPAAGKAMPCCDDDAGKPVKHDAKACAQACAVVCGAGVAFSAPATELSLTETHARLEPAAPSPLHAHGPPGLKRPPKLHA